MDVPVLVEVPLDGPLKTSGSVKNSPIHMSTRKNSYSNTSSSCSSQVINNNYSAIEMESLEDILRKVITR